MKQNKNVFEVIFFARGGQGAKVATEILAHAANAEGKHVQTFPFFGPERSGAPTKFYLRISDAEIRSHEPVVDPDVVAIMDETLLDTEVMTTNLDRDEMLIINSRKTPQEIKEKIQYEGKIYPIDATGISMDVLGQPRPNTVFLGKFVQVTGIVSLASVVDAFKEIFLEKIGEAATVKNIQAIEKAYDTI